MSLHFGAHGAWLVPGMAITSHWALLCTWHSLVLAGFQAGWKFLLFRVKMKGLKCPRKVWSLDVVIGTGWTMQMKADSSCAPLLLTPPPPPSLVFFVVQVAGTQAFAG